MLPAPQTLRSTASANHFEPNKSVQHQITLGVRRHPIENKRNFLEVDGEILERVYVIYYGDPSRLR